MICFPQERNEEYVLYIQSTKRQALFNNALKYLHQPESYSPIWWNPTNQLRPPTQNNVINYTEDTKSMSTLAIPASTHPLLAAQQSPPPSAIAARRFYIVRTVDSLSRGHPTQACPYRCK